jgi:hypothetical protein
MAAEMGQMKVSMKAGSMVVRWEKMTVFCLASRWEEYEGKQKVAL